MLTYEGILELIRASTDMIELQNALVAAQDYRKQGGAGWRELYKAIERRRSEIIKGR